VLAIDAISGGLSAVTGSPFAVGGAPHGIAVDVSGRFVYVTDTAVSNNSYHVRAFTLDGVTGALAEISGSPYAVQNYPHAVTTTGALAVSSATLQSAEIMPSNPTITSTSASGHSLQLTLVGHYSDGTTKFLTESGTWSSSTTSVATVSNNTGSKGLATSTGYGTTTISASYGGQTATTALTVQAPVLVSIAVIPGAPTIASGTAVQFHATGTYSDNSTLDLTNSVTWSTSDNTIATVSNTSGSQGLATSVTPGTVTITAALGGIPGRATLTAQ